MKQFYWLVRREIWEHKNAVLWTPLALAALFLLLMMAAAAYGIITNQASNGIYVNNLELDLAHNAGEISVTAVLLIMWTAALLQFVYCASTIFDERDDRSLLFWKSLPASDIQVILSKVTLAVLIIPCFAIVAIELFTVGVMAIEAVVTGTTQFKHTNSEGFHIGKLAWLLLAFYPGYLLSCIATVGWALLVSSLAKSKPMLWAIGLPALLAMCSVIIAQMFGSQSEAVAKFFLMLMASGLPGMHVTYDNNFKNLDLDRTYDPVAHYHALFSGPMPLLLAFTGVAAIVITIKLRRRGLR